MATVSPLRETLPGEPAPSQAQAPARPTIAQRLRVLRRQRQLDDRLAAGANPNGDPVLAERARQLTHPRRRRALARNLARIGADTRRVGPRLSAAAPVARRDVRAARSALGALERALRDEPDVAPAGVVLVERLLGDGAGPLYVAGGEDALRRAIEDATRALYDM